MSIGSVIANCRKNMGLTQDALAQQLGVTNQAVSKWESDQTCPDILLLPKLADIFGITIDQLFGREVPKAEPVELVPATEVNDLPWPDDGTLRVVLYAGHTYIGSTPEQEKITFEYEGPALNIDCAVNLTCNEVCGNVRAGGDVTCDTVNGSVDAGGSVSCDDVMGNVNAGGNVSCDSVDGNVSAGMDVTCDEVEGNVCAGRDVTCDEVSGNITAGGTVTTGEGGPGQYHFSMGNKGKKNHHVHITLEESETTPEGTADEDIEDKVESGIEKLVNDILRKSGIDFRL